MWLSYVIYRAGLIPLVVKNLVSGACGVFFCINLRLIWHHKAMETNTLTSRGTIYVVDDNAEEVKLLGLMLRRLGYAFLGFQSAGDAVRHMQNNGEATLPDAIICDLLMPGMDGFAFLETCRGRWPNMPILILTAHDSVTDAVKAIKNGAYDYLAKPMDVDRLDVTLHNLLHRACLQQTVSNLRKSRDGLVSFDDVIGPSKAMHTVFDLMRKVAPSEVPVLITGESGVGKDLVAKAIHSASSRAEGPLVVVNCAAIPAGLVESTLFGHEKGAFTGALGRTLGKFRAADGGTLFLDEIGELPMDVQTKLLRVLQNNEVEPVGAEHPVPVNVRLITATHRNLGQMVVDGHFREDLFYRVHVFPVHIPSLRDRREDIAPLANHFVRRARVEHGQKAEPLSPAVIEFLTNLPWPGNVRQLENAIDRAVILSEGAPLTVQHFHWLKPNVTPMVRNGDRLPDARDDIRPLAVVEAAHIRRALEICDGNMAEVARRLGISRATLYRRMQTFTRPTAGNSNVRTVSMQPVLLDPRQSDN